MHTLAVIETTASLEDVRDLLAGFAGAAPFRIEHFIKSPHGSSWYSVCVAVSQTDDALATTRGVLEALLHFADRGLLDRFRIVWGSWVLRDGPAQAWQADVP
ncbi:MAG TPA: hypothetical protein VFS55_08470 [Dokdonella sp.]|nr:hypothetical protein [Dokdonella sp.]